jgi:ubiquinone/menaquinone biosynthesis C-methylase UbiE
MVKPMMLQEETGASTAKPESQFSTVTEAPGQGATAEQLSMLSTRYHLALQHSQDKDVLEVACGSGIGLGYLATKARTVVGGDIDSKNLEIAQANYAHNPQITLQQFDAQSMPFADASFDLMLLYEAIYYIPDAQAFIQEAHRVLRPDGKLIIVSVNREWVGFNPSPFSVKYYSAKELTASASQIGFAVKSFAGYLDNVNSLLKRSVRLVRRGAVALNLVPKTMNGKRLLKRLFYGKLDALPTQLTAQLAPLEPLVEINSPEQAMNYKVLYVIASKPK